MASSLVDKQFDEICVQNQNFDHYEKMFQEVIIELESDDVLESFRREYESLHQSYTVAHKGETQLIKKCTDLAAEINSCILKVRSAEELSSGDQNTIDQLKKEIVKAKSKITQSRETEVTLKEKIKQLKVDIKELDKQVDRGAVGVAGNDTTIQDLTRVRGDLQKDHDTQKSHLQALQRELDYLEGRISKITEEKDVKSEELSALQLVIVNKKAEIEAQVDRKEDLERRLKAVKENLGKRSKLVIENQQTINKHNKDIDGLQTQLGTVREDAERGLKDHAQLTKLVKQTNDDLRDCEDYNKALERDLVQLEHQLKLKNGEVANVQREAAKQNKLVESIHKRNVVLETQRADSENKRNSMRVAIQQKELDINNLSKQAENDRKQLEDLTRERDILNKNYLKAQSSTQKQRDWLVVKENQRRNLEHQIRGYERHAQMQAEMIHQLTKEAETYEEEAQEASLRYTRAMEDVRSQEQATIDEQKKIQDAESKLKQQQNMLETVLNERNLYSKNYNQLRSEISEMGRRFKIMLNQIKQLKEEIQSKEKELVSEEARVNALTKERKDHEIHIDASKKKTEKRERTIDVFNTELHKLNQIIADADAEKSRQKRDHINVMNERDILGTQLIKRNDELAKLYEKIRIQQSTLRKGEAQYNDRLRDIQHLKLRESQLAIELTKMKEFASRLPDLKLLMNNSQRELTREQCRVRNLLDECDNPQNVHRLHKLHWSEPQTYEMHSKVRQLQKELVEKSNEVSEKDRIISEKEKLYVELKAIIGRQPGPEVAEQLNVYQDSLQKKTGQMKAMKMSLKHFQEQVEHYKARVEELNDELGQMGESYFESRKAETRKSKQQRIINEMMGRPADAPVEEEPDQNEYVGYTAPPRPQTQGSDAEGYIPEGLPPEDNDDVAPLGDEGHEVQTDPVDDNEPPISSDPRGATPPPHEDDEVYQDQGPSSQQQMATEGAIEEQYGVPTDDIAPL